MQTQGPWKQNPEPPRPDRNLRFVVWLALLALGTYALWQLADAYPDSLGTSGERAGFVWGVVIAALLGARLIVGRRARLGEALRNALFWALLALLLMFVYAYQDEFRAAAARVGLELRPSEPAVITDNVMVLTMSSDGHFYALGEADGTPVRFLVDTGSSDIVLSPGDARRLGINMADLSFTRSYETANGIGRGAPYTLHRLKVGPIELHDIEVSVNESGSSPSLLGMAFLKRLASYEFEGRKLYLRWRS